MVRKLINTGYQGALVLCVDEKSQCQALERSQPILPLGPGRAERATHDYFRHGTVSLFVALDVKTGEVIGRCQSRHTQRHFVRFLKQIDASVPADLDLHLVLDNYAAHKAPAVRRWLARHPCFHLHFIPTHSSWLNQVERWFAKITHQAIRRGSFRSVPHLRQTILDYIAANNRAPTPFVWTASADFILGNPMQNRRLFLCMSFTRWNGGGPIPGSKAGPCICCLQRSGRP